MKTTLNLKLMIFLKYQNIKAFSQKVCTSNWSEKVFVIKKVKDTVPWTDTVPFY